MDINSLRGRIIFLHTALLSLYNGLLMETLKKRAFSHHHLLSTKGLLAQEVNFLLDRAEHLGAEHFGAEHFRIRR